MLDTIEIDKILRWEKSTAISFRGVYSSDELPVTTPTSSLYVINTDPSTKPGEHWVVVYIGVKRHCDYFDSFGRVPLVKSIENFVNKNSKACTFNDRVVQSPLSTACGFHCVYFAVRRCLGLDMNSIVGMYTDNLYQNDEIVRKYVANMMKQ